MTIVDPACGSGHFLLAAARRLADHVARIRSAGTPTPDDYQHALRDVVRRCIYGVDVNPLAVELCKVSLWMESIDPGLPLTFLESHIRCGNSLIGTTRALMGEQVPAAAWVALEGDDKKVTRSLKRRNQEEIAGQRSLLFEPRNETDTLRDAIRAVEQAPDADASTLEEKHRKWKALLASQAYEHEKLVADAWCAAFLWPKEAPGPVVEAEIYVRSDVTLPDAIRRAIELAIAGRTDGDRVRRSIVNLNDPALVKARSAAVRGERKRLAKDSASRIETGDERKERASQLLGRRQLPEFVSIRVAWLRKTLGRGR